MAVPVYAPQVRVYLFKLIQRTNGVAQRYTKARRRIDLTPYLSETGIVATDKPIYAGAGGFTIAFGDQVDPTTNDTLYALIEPMDLVEIRMGRIPTAGPVPLIMRGFVSSIRRQESMGGDGTPMRQIILQGQDGSMLFSMSQILWELAASGGEPMIGTFRLQDLTGLSAVPMTTGAFVTQLVQKVVNPKIADLAAVSQQIIAPMQTDLVTVADGYVFPPQVQQFEGELATLLESVADRPWNEMWVQDQEDGWHLVFRPCPWVDVDGNYIMPGAVDPGTVTIDISDIVALDLARSTAGIANYFWVPPDGNTINSAQVVTTAAIASGSLLQTGHGNNDPRLFGVRKMQVSTRLYGDGVSAPISQLSGGERNGAAISQQGWIGARRNQLELLNQDNGVFESGTAQVKGSENLKPGLYARFVRGAVTSENYITRVAHTFNPFGLWTSALTLERGTNFATRITMEGSPMWLEGRQGPMQQWQVPTS